MILLLFAPGTPVVGLGTPPGGTKIERRVGTIRVERPLGTVTAR